MTIKAQSISLELGNKVILKDISFDVLPGEVVSVIGPNGAGKTSLLNILTGNIKCTSGNVMYDSKELNKISIQERAYIRAVMSQFQSVAFDYTVLDIIKMGWLDLRFDHSKIDLEAFQNQIINECDVDNLLNQTFNTLSGGEQRRVHFARTLLQLWRPDTSKDQNYLLLDEPFSNLDLVHKVKMVNSIKARASNGTGVMMILHDLNLAFTYSDKLCILKDGQIVAFDDTSKLMSEKLLSEVYGIDIVISEDPLQIKYF